MHECLCFLYCYYCWFLSVCKGLLFMTQILGFCFHVMGYVQTEIIWHINEYIIIINFQSIYPGQWVSLQRWCGTSWWWNVHVSGETFSIIHQSVQRQKTIYYRKQNQLLCQPYFHFLISQDCFLPFFRDKIIKLRLDLDSQPVCTSSLPLTNPFDGVPLCTFKPVSESVVKNLTLKSAPKTCQLDPIPTPLLVKCLNILLPSLTALVNSSLSSGVFPKFSKLLLLHLSSRKNLLTRINWRTIILSLIFPLSPR